MIYLENNKERKSDICNIKTVLRLKRIPHVEVDFNDVENKTFKNDDYLFGSVDFVNLKKITHNKIFNSSYLTFNFGKHFLNNDGISYLGIDNLRIGYFSIFDCFAVDGCIFVKPEDRHKYFSGQLLDIINVKNFCKENSDFDKSIFIAKPKKIKAEWRLFIKNSSILTSSLYKFQNLVSPVEGCPPQVIKFVDSFLPVFYSKNPDLYDELLCMDVCMLDDGKNSVKLVEFNNAYSSGFYKCDASAIISALNI